MSEPNIMAIHQTVIEIYHSYSTIQINPMVALQEKSEDHPNQRASSSGDHHSLATNHDHILYMLIFTKGNCQFGEFDVNFV